MAKLSLYVLAAGMGSRYGGLKQMDQVGPSGEAIIDYSIYDALQAGFDRVVFVIRREIESEFREVFQKRWAGKVALDFVFQELDMVPEGFRVPADRSKPWGTGHAVLVAAGKINTPFAVINADDFYGRNAYELTASYLLEQQERGRDLNFCMVGFELQRTLSKHGTVARGVCHTDEQGYLTDIREITSIGWQDDRIGYTGADGGFISLRGEEPVSMNIWGFSPAIFPLLDREFKSFLSTHAEQPKAEFYIPTLIQEIIRRNEGRVRVLPNHENWFGVTYREDKPQVMAQIRALVDQGLYPSDLFRT